MKNGLWDGVHSCYIVGVVGDGAHQVSERAH